MSIKKLLEKIYLAPMLSPERANYYQEIIRRAEWESVKTCVPPESKFLDVGCGAGYNLKAAKDELQCEVVGIDPHPGLHGVGAFKSPSENSIYIHTGVSEHLPYEDESFDVVFSSHVLEHVESFRESLSEMKRVLRKNGTLIIGMPTATMAWISLFSQLLFTTHMRWFAFFVGNSFHLKRPKVKFLFLPESHSVPGRTILYDIRNYRIKIWRRIISNDFKVERELKPALYCYPDFRQLFKLRKSRKIGSSVFYICTKY